MFQQLMINKMNKEAIRISKAVINRVTYSCNDKEALFNAACEIASIDPMTLNKEQISALMKYCSSIEGVCYMLGLELGFLSGGIVLRCAQFTAMVDNYLYNHGVIPCPKEIKIQYYKYLQLYDLYNSHKEIFSL